MSAESITRTGVVEREARGSGRDAMNMQRPARRSRRYRSGYYTLYAYNLITRSIARLQTLQKKSVRENIMQSTSGR